ncbi:MAG: LytTR family transcriptional regulator DNA-binding domain-containing protein [Oscillospiraceae bacterium]|nr:LytTR family transcriptional regulator DNA-binding domain-containing protein [Oscillospiraceae bacterium]
MKVSIRSIAKKEDEQVVLECVELTEDFADIRDYALTKSNTLTGYIGKAAYELNLKDILYFESVGDHIFAYTDKQVYTVKMRLYEVESRFSRSKFVRGSNTIIINLLQIESFRPSIGANVIARMKTGEEVVLSRMYAKEMKLRMGEF